MRVFFDTEFLEDGSTIKLISIGMVREDGATFYAETPNAQEIANSDEWLRKNVLPHLRWEQAETLIPELAERIREFVGPNPEFWAYYAAYDWVALCQLYGRMIDLPDGFPFYCRDLQQAIDLAGVGKPPKQTAGEHDALADALWTRDAWLWLRDNGGSHLLVPSALPASAGRDAR